MTEHPTDATPAMIEAAKAVLFERKIVDTFSIKAALEAALEAAKPSTPIDDEGLWQPIKTAPKDQWVITWSAVEGHGLGRYCDVAEGWGPTTHWMKLPAGPPNVS